jgi:hypothetical protein
MSNQGQQHTKIIANIGSIPDIVFQGIIIKQFYTTPTVTGMQK